MTCFTGTLCLAAAVRQSSNSGAAFRTSLSRVPIFMRISP